MKKIKLLLISFLFFTNAGLCCTIVSCSRNGKAFAAANEDDYTSTLYAKIWFNPPTKERYGTVCFGMPDLQAQQIMNEYGLFVDFTAQNGIDPSKFNLKHPYNGDLFFEILGKCKTVKEALAFLKTHDYAGTSQALLADAQGYSVIINAQAKVPKQGNYQINTNFNICDLKNGISDRRYDLANGMLSASSGVSISFLKELLDRTHQEGDLTTLYSYIFDMKQGLIYVYFFHNFDHVYIIDVKKELKRGYRLENLADHFPASFAYENLIKNDKSRKEQILSEIDKKGLDVTMDHYMSVMEHPSKKDSTITPDMFEVAVQLIKNSSNQHNNGAMWEYWFSLPGGYTIRHFKDKRLDAAERVFKFLRGKPNDPKFLNFVTELEAYVDLIQGDTATAKTLYELCIAKPQLTYPVSYNRTKEMLTRID